MPRTPARFVDGDTFKRARLRFGLTQVEAAERCGVDETTIQRWESGFVQRVRRVYLEKLANGEGSKKRGA